MGLAIPKMTQLFLALKRRGVPVDTSVFRWSRRGRPAAAAEKGARRMLKDVTLGQYFPGQTPIHKLDPRTKLVFVILYIVVLFLAKWFVSYLLVAAFLGAVIWISKIHLSVIFKSLKPLLLIIILTAVLNLFYSSGEPIVKFWIFKITKEGIFNAVFMALRIMLLVAGNFYVNLYDLADLADGRAGKPAQSAQEDQAAGA